MAQSSREIAFQRWLDAAKAKPRLPLSFSIRNLSVYGFTSSRTFQSTAASYALALPRLALNLLSKRSITRLQILRGINGIVHNGEMLLVLGRPGSGCTTLLKALAGDTHGIVIGEESILNYQGISHEKMQQDFKGESIYLAELDVHLPDLTLGQTLAFAVSTRQKNGQTGQSTADTVSHDIATLFGLEKAFETWMGNANIRGVSGGERRRTTLAEAIAGGAQLRCWDNSTRGLDSATAQRVVVLLAESTRSLGSTVAMTIYQASDAMYHMFDKVMVLYEGRQIYFGHVHEAVSYFNELGFSKPSRATIADFLTSITNPDERVIRPGYEHRAPRSPDEFAVRWQQSTEGKALEAEIHSFESNNPLYSEKGPKCGEENKRNERLKLSLRGSTYAIPIHRQVLICLKRGVRRLRNEPAAAIALAVANAVLAVVLGSVFYNLSHTTDSMDQRSVLIFFSVMLTAFTPAFEVLTIWAQRPIVEKHNRYAFYHPSADAAASMICDIPNKLLTAIFFQVVIYFMTNLRRTVLAFLTWFIVNLVLVLTMSAWFRLLGSVARRREHTMAPSSIIIMLCVIYIGYVVPVPYMVGWLAWFRRVNPIAYAYESLMINEFRNRKFACLSTVPAGPSYNTIGLEGKICAQIGAMAGQGFVEGSTYIFKKYDYKPSHIWRNLSILIAMAFIVSILHLFATQYIPAKRSKGDVLQFRRNSSRSTIVADAESESGVMFAQDINRQSRSASQESAHQDITGMVPLQRPNSVFNWQNLCYDVGSKRILNNIDGWVKPGTLTALMGVTGAGKTTLLDVLAKRTATGTASGSVFIDGDLRDASFQRKIGYVQQEDIHMPSTTVREALEFSASLRQTGKSTEEKLSYVDSIIALLDMDSYADAVVGVPGDGLNIEQRKRLTIGVELAGKPELLLFLDEPTSGMDSQTAWSICRLLRKLADNGQAVLCTIHQPSSQLFCMFDRLILLNNHGETIYFGDIGPDASTMVGYFEKNGAQSCPPAANPAEWALMVTNDNPSHNTEMKLGGASWSQAWESSPEKKAAIQQLSEFQALETSAGPSHTTKSKYATSYARQLIIVSRRLFQEYWRDPLYLYTKVALCGGMALLNGLSFQNARLDIQGLTDIVFSIFLVTQLFSTLNQQIILRFADGMTMYEARERRAKSYNWAIFLVANLIVEAVWQTIAAILVFAMWYYPTGLWRNGNDSFSASNRGALSLVMVWLFCLWVTTLSQALATGVKNSEVAIQICTLFFWFSLVFCGVLVTPSNLPKFWKFMNRVSPLTYFTRGLTLAALVDTKITCSAVELLHINPPSDYDNATCAVYLRAYIDDVGGYVVNPAATTDCQFCPLSDANTFLHALGMVPQSNAWLNAGYLAVYIAANSVAIFALYWLVRMPRGKSKV